MGVAQHVSQVKLFTIGYQSGTCQVGNWL